jgi:hypothetical protein
MMLRYDVVSLILMLHARAFALLLLLALAFGVDVYVRFVCTRWRLALVSPMRSLEGTTGEQQKNALDFCLHLVGK